MQNLKCNITKPHPQLLWELIVEKEYSNSRSRPNPEAETYPQRLLIAETASYLPVSICSSLFSLVEILAEVMAA
jgi:hypothetical protein